jgi:tetratricopeptide (TPR) repeat protein
MKMFLTKLFLPIFVILFSASPLLAQNGDAGQERANTLSEAKYLKSIYKTDEAIEKLSSLVKPDTFDEEVMSELADCHFQSGDYETAAGTYFLLSSRVPDNILYKIRQMQTFSRMEAWPQSIQAGREVLRLDSIPAVLSSMGDSFQRMNQPDSALLYYRQSLALKPRNANVVSKAANVLLGKEDFDGAIALTDAFLANDPDNMTIAPVKGLALYRKNDFDAAIDVFQRQEDIGNDTYPIHYYLGQCYWQTKLIYRADQELLKAWQIDSSDVKLAYSIAAVKAEGLTGFEKEVKPWLDKALDMLQPDAGLMSRIHQQYAAGYYGKRDNWDKAIEHYKEAYRYNPKFLSALQMIAYCYEQQKDYKHALEYYEKLLKVANPGSKSYEFATKSISFLKSELFMEGKE